MLGFRPAVWRPHGMHTRPLRFLRGEYWGRGESVAPVPLDTAPVLKFTMCRRRDGRSPAACEMPGRSTPRRSCATESFWWPADCRRIRLLAEPSFLIRDQAPGRQRRVSRSRETPIRQLWLATEKCWLPAGSHSPAVDRESVSSEVYAARGHPRGISRPRVQATPQRCCRTEQFWLRVASLVNGWHHWSRCQRERGDLLRSYRRVVAGGGGMLSTG